MYSYIYVLDRIQHLTVNNIIDFLICMMLTNSTTMSEQYTTKIIIIMYENAHLEVARFGMVRGL